MPSVLALVDGVPTQISISGGGNPLHTGASPPSDPADQPLWWDSTNGKLYVYYNDGDSSQWVGIVVSISAGDLPDTDWADITSKPETFPPSAHGHVIENIAKPLEDLGSDSGTINLSLDDGHHQKLTLTDDATINPPTTPTTEVITLKLLLEIDAASGVVVTWGTGIEPLGGVLPDFDVADNGVNYVILEGVPGVGWILDGGSVT